MNLRYLAVLMLMTFVASPSGGETPLAVDSSVKATASLADSVAHESAPDEPWVDIIGGNGPQGIAEIGKNIAVCGAVRLDPDSKKLIAATGASVVAALSKQPYGEANNLLSTQPFGDCEVQLEFLIGKGSNSGVKLQERYEIQLYDSHQAEKPTAKECGGIYPHWLFRADGKGIRYIDQGVPPLRNAAKPAGEWQTLKIVFKAPRFNDQGKKTASASFESVVLNGKVVHEAVEVDSPTGNASSPLPEVAKAPLMLQLDHGAVAFRNVRVKPLSL